jgi:hypothetical protein
MRPLRIIRGLGGNGSTFISRAVATIENVVLLSEINPSTANLFAFALNPVIQIEKNYGHLKFDLYKGNMVELGSPKLFRKYIDFLLAECNSIRYDIVIRDYSYVDYVGVPFIWVVPEKSSLDEALNNLQTFEILIIRHPISQFLSLVSHAELKNVLDPATFLRGYRIMLDRHRLALVARFEDLFAAFDQKMHELMAHLHLSLSSDWKARIPSVDWVTGNEFGKTSTQPEATSRKLNSEIRELFRPIADYQLICRECGYDP